MSITVAECGEITAILSGIYPNATFTEKSPAAWHFVLKDYTREEVQAAFQLVIKDHPEFCPSAPAIAKAIDDAKNPPIDVSTAWDAVHKAIRRAGCANVDGCEGVLTLEFAGTPMERHTDSVISAARAIGWRRLGLTEFDHHEGMFNQFRRCLEGATTTAKHTANRQAITPPLPVEHYPVGWGVTDEDRRITRQLRGEE